MLPLGLGHFLSRGTLQLNRKRPQAPQGATGIQRSPIPLLIVSTVLYLGQDLGTVRGKICKWVRMVENREGWKTHSSALGAGERH